MFQADSGTTSACADACAAAWPPLTSVTPKTGNGAKASLVSTATRSDRTPQVIYNGEPLYTFSGDKKAGNTNEGVNAFGGLRYVLSPRGTEITSTPSTSGSSGGSSGSSGY